MDENNQELNEREAELPKEEDGENQLILIKPSNTYSMKMKYQRKHSNRHQKKLNDDLIEEMDLRAEQQQLPKARKVPKHILVQNLKLQSQKSRESSREALELQPQQPE